MTEGTCSNRYPYLPGRSVKLYWGQCGCDTALVRRGDRRVRPGCGRSSELDEVDKAILAGQDERLIPETTDR